MDLNDTLASLPIFSCKICTQFLLPPIRLVANIGYVCGLCDLPTHAMIIPDSALQFIIRHLTFPCPNAAKGCEEKLPYTYLSSHIQTCLSRDYQCPFRFITDCIWEGGASSILDHANDCHTEHVVSANDGNYEFQVDISTSNSAIKILHTKCDNFILLSRCDFLKSKLFYFLYYIGSKEEKQSDSYFVQQIGNTTRGSFLQNTCKQKILHINDFTMNPNENSGFSEYLACVIPFKRGTFVRTVIRIDYHSEKYAMFLNFFKCPNCHNVMRLPIFQCEGGHSVCENCKSKISNCPISKCGRKFCGTRNYCLESMGAIIKSPCAYSTLGCKFTQCINNITTHESACKFRSYDCWMCIWKGPHPNLLKHLETEHTKKCKIIKRNKEYKFYCNETADYCIIINGSIFLIAYKKNGSDSWNSSYEVEYVGPHINAKKYKYEMGYELKNDFGQMIVCQAVNGENKKLNINFPYYVASLTSSMYYTPARIPLHGSYFKITTIG